MAGEETNTELGDHFSSQRVGRVLWTQIRVAGRGQVMDVPPRTLNVGSFPHALAEGTVLATASLPSTLR